MSTRRLTPFALTATLLVVACGGSDDAPEATDLAATDAPVVATAPSTSEPNQTTPESTDPPPTDPPETDAPATTDPPATDAPATTEPAPDPTAPSVEEVDPDGQLSAPALELLARFDGERFPSEVVDDGVANGPLFVELARVSAVPSVTAAALDGVRATHCFFDEDECTLVTQETVDMLIGRLTLDEDPGALLAALDLAERVVSNTPVDDDALSDQVFAVVVGLGNAADDPRLVRAVIGAIGTQGFYPGGPAFRGSAELEELFRAAIASDDASLAYVSLSTLNMGNPDEFPESDNFYGVVTAELDDPDARVRGAALKTLSSFAEFVDETDPRWNELFAIGDSARTDPDSWVRYQALKVWGSLDDLTVIPTIVADHLDDDAEAEIDLSFERYDGSAIPGSLSNGSVSLGALEVLTELTRGTDVEFDVSEYEFERGFDAPPIGEQVAEQAVPDARDWFAANEDAIAAAALGE